MLELSDKTKTKIGRKKKKRTMKQKNKSNNKTKNSKTQREKQKTRRYGTENGNPVLITATGLHSGVCVLFSFRDEIRPRPGGGLVALLPDGPRALLRMRRRWPKVLFFFSSRRPLCRRGAPNNGPRVAPSPEPFSTARIYSRKGRRERGVKLKLKYEYYVVHARTRKNTPGTPPYTRTHTRTYAHDHTTKYNTCVHGHTEKYNTCLLPKLYYVSV